MDPVTTVLAVTDFWGGDGKTWLAWLAIIGMPLLSLVALWQARIFVRKI
jgi:hypothetical protein